MINKRLICVVFLFASLDIICQIKFPTDPRVSQLNDSIVYELNHSKYWSYFKNRIDSIFIQFDTVKFYQRAVIDRETKNGYYELYYKKKLLVRHEIVDDKVSGLGILYHPNYFGEKNDIPYCQAIFRDDRLNGAVIHFDKNGIVEKILLYKKGKYKKYIYHHKAKTKKVLREFSRASKGTWW